MALTMPAFAAGSNRPWEQPLQQILQSIEGPVAKIIAVIIIITTGLTLAFGDTSGGFRRLVQIVFGLSVAFAASMEHGPGGLRLAGWEPPPVISFRVLTHRLPGAGLQPR